MSSCSNPKKSWSEKKHHLNSFAFMCVLNPLTRKLPNLSVVGCRGPGAKPGKPTKWNNKCILKGGRAWKVPHTKSVTGKKWLNIANNVWNEGGVESTGHHTVLAVVQWLIVRTELAGFLAKHWHNVAHLCRPNQSFIDTLSHAKYNDTHDILWYLMIICNYMFLWSSMYKYIWLYMI